MLTGVVTSFQVSFGPRFVGASLFVSVIERVDVDGDQRDALHGPVAVAPNVDAWQNGKSIYVQYALHNINISLGYFSYENMEKYFVLDIQQNQMFLDSFSVLEYLLA